VLAPFLADRVDELESFDDVKLLTVAVDRLPLWHKPGLLCIGDAAHAMSPVGGVGINLAIQDAIAAANILALPLSSEAPLSDALLAQVQKRREWPTKVFQGMQVVIQKRIISRVLGGTGKIAPPRFLRLFITFPVLRRLPARLIGLGVRRERITSRVRAIPQVANHPHWGKKRRASRILSRYPPMDQWLSQQGQSRGHRSASRYVGSGGHCSRRG
jgi:hypothetical protein